MNQKDVIACAGTRNYVLQAGSKSILFPLKLAVKTGIHFFGTSFENIRLSKSKEMVFVLTALD